MFESNGHTIVATVEQLIGKKSVMKIGFKMLSFYLNFIYYQLPSITHLPCMF